MVLTMKMRKLRIAILIALGVSTGQLYAQKADLLYAESQYSQQNFRKAALEFGKLYEDSPSYEIGKKIAVSFDAIYEFKDSHAWWSKVVSYAEASREDYLRFLLSGRRTDAGFDAGALLSGSSYSVSDFPELTPVVSVSHVPFRKYEVSNFSELNSGDSDYGLHFLSSGKRLFASNRGEVVEEKKKIVRLDAVSAPIKKGSYHSDQRNYYGLYSQTAGDSAVLIDVEGFTLHHLSDPMVVKGTNTVFFTATPNRLRRKDEVIYPGIYRGIFEESSNKIVDVVSFPLNQTNEYGTMNPVIDQDSQLLYFSSNVKGGLGGYDLYSVDFDSAWNFGKATNMGPLVNSVGNERDPHFGSDSYFYFSSDGRSGYGGMDVYRVLLTENVPSGTAENLGAPVNTNWDDFGFQLSGDRLAYLSSDRLEGFGYDDFYKVGWKDKKVQFAANSTDDSGSDLLKTTEIELMEGGVGKPISLEELAVLLAGQGEVEVRLNRAGHFRTTQKLVLEEDQETISLNLVAIPYELDVYESIIYYDLNKADLRALSKEKLDEITLFMTRHPELSLSIASHTDSRASLKYNEKLSERRARSVTNYLDDRGVDKERVSAAWYSETRLLNDCVDGADCPEDIHERNRRSELTLRAFPDRTQQYDLPAGASASDFSSPEAARKWFGRKD